MKTTFQAICYKYRPLKNNEFPIKLRITQNRKFKYIDLDVSTKLEDWDFIRNKPKPTSPDCDLIEHIINQTINKYRGKIIEAKARGIDLTLTSLIEDSGRPHKAKTVAETFHDYITLLRKQKRYGYATSIELVLHSLVKFNKHLNIYFSDIDIAWLKRYELWLRENNLAENTIGIRFRTLRVIYNYAVENGDVQAELYPFKKYKVSKLHQETAKRSICKDDMLKIINYQNDNCIEYRKFAIDVFTFSYLMGGINFKDIAYLTQEHIIGSQLVYRRIKTKKLIKLPLHPIAQSIICKYSSENSPYLFPILTGIHTTYQQQANRIHKVITKVNRELKLIGLELNLPITLTTYVARHSYATILKRSGVNTAIISEALGHSSEKVTQIYLDSFENDQIDEAMKNLL